MWIENPSLDTIIKVKVKLLTSIENLHLEYVFLLLINSTLSKSETLIMNRFYCSIL